LSIYRAEWSREHPSSFLDRAADRFPEACAGSISGAAQHAISLVPPIALKMKEDRLADPRIVMPADHPE